MIFVAIDHAWLIVVSSSLLLFSCLIIIVIIVDTIVASLLLYYFDVGMNRPVHTISAILVIVVELVVVNEHFMVDCCIEYQ
jgi:Na+/melibiose symporter-like transporter